MIRRTLAVAALGCGLIAPAALAGTSPSAAAGAVPYPAAPAWHHAAHAMPERPASCPKLTTDSTVTAEQPSPKEKESPTGHALWPVPAKGSDPEDYANDHTRRARVPKVPANWATDGNNWKLTSLRNPDAAVSSNPQELCGVEGNSVDDAWQTTTGRPTTVIAVLDSGIDWCQPGLVDKIALNRAALPPPENAAGKTKSELEHAGQSFSDDDPYDLDDSGVLDVAQYAADPRVAAVVADYGGTFCSTHGAGDGYSGLSAEDLIRTFGDARLPGGAANPYYVSADSPAGFTDAIAGWNFVDNDNDPYDDVSYGHGTGEGLDMVGAADNSVSEVGVCPDCMIMPVRVGTSFVTTGDPFGEGVLFAVDSGATVVSEALGVTNVTPTDAQAIEYAAANQVPIVGSAADEESEHANLPAAASGDIIDVNSTTQEMSWSPPSSLYLNGCTNYGPAIDLTVESSSCSSEATSKTAGTVGLIESEAESALEAGRLAPSGYDSAAGREVPLSADEVKQILTMSADDVNFQTAAPSADPPAPKDDYSVSGTGIPFGTTTRYPTTPGYDIYSGWGRLDAARAVRWVAEGRVPPQALIASPAPLVTYDSHDSVAVDGTVGSPRYSSVRYQVDVGIGAAPSARSWHVVAEGTAGKGGKTGLLATISGARLAALFAAAGESIRGGPVTKSGAPDDDRFTFSIRVLVLATNGLVGVAQQAEYLHDDPSLLPGFPWHFASSLVAPEKLAQIGPHGEDVLIVAESDGTVHAYLPDHKELPGWPVHTDVGFAHRKERAYATGAVKAVPRGEIVGGVAVGDLADASGHDLDVVVTDTLGNVYAWNAKGKLLAGWPQHSDPAYSEPSARNADNRLLPGFFAAPALGDLQGNGTLDVVAPSLDRHVYAWQPDGTPVPGWPVLVVDPHEVQSVDPRTNAVTFLPGADPDMGSELVDTPAIGRLQGGAGPPDVILGADEEYAGAPDADLGALGALLASELKTANARVYAIEPDGSLHKAVSGAPEPPGMPDPGAFVPGWPVAVADLEANLLPLIGDGVTGSPALADLAGNGKLEVITSSVAGPVYELDPTGASYLGTSGGLPRVAAFAPKGKLLSDLLSAAIPALGAPSVGVLGTGGASEPLTVATPTASLGRLLDEAEPAEQSPHDDQVSGWSASTGQMVDGSPHLMNDLQFFDSPLFADLTGDGQGDLVETSGLGDLRAYTSTGAEVAGFPKFTGGWSLFSPVVGPFGTDTEQVLAVGNRSGELFAWATSTPACASSGSWAEAHHDLWNSGDVSEKGAALPACSKG